MRDYTRHPAAGPRRSAPAETAGAGRNGEPDGATIAKDAPRRPLGKAMAAQYKYLSAVQRSPPMAAGRDAAVGCEPGQVRKEAALSSTGRVPSMSRPP